MMSWQGGQVTTMHRRAALLRRRDHRVYRSPLNWKLYWCKRCTDATFCAYHVCKDGLGRLLPLRDRPER